MISPDRQPEERPPLPSSVDSGPEQRVQPRFALLLRQAKLLSDGCEYLCIVRDVSESGFKLKLFHPLPGLLPQSSGFALEITTGEAFPVEHVWEQDGEAGFRFTAPVDLARFIAEAGPFPKRPVRLKVEHPALIAFGGQEYFAMIHDLSRQGARIETEQMLAIGQKMRFAARELPHFDATVCWRQHPFYGLVFDQLLSLEQLALRTYRIQHPLAPLLGE
jgi:hypothetical protein